MLSPEEAKQTMDEGVGWVFVGVCAWGGGKTEGRRLGCNSRLFRDGMTVRDEEGTGVRTWSSSMTLSRKSTLQSSVAIVSSRQTVAVSEPMSSMDTDSSSEQ